MDVLESLSIAICALEVDSHRQGHGDRCLHRWVELEKVQRKEEVEGTADAGTILVGRKLPR